MMSEEYQDNFSKGESVNVKEKQNFSNSLIRWKPEGQEDQQKEQKSVVVFPFIVGKGDANTKFSLCKNFRLYSIIIQNTYFCSNFIFLSSLFFVVVKQFTMWCFWKVSISIHIGKI